ncbi:protein FrlC [Cribrihabitans marinus]|uniref:Protein FrlC n=1 Tax=Cribrihabitans marinus TaxID=1227549 RepID=A0A1H7E5E3_9RHOB|nr:sugar phosphate isomerase/epimerase family protein [Cribrihabitans marinus]GGH42049.1 sugar phosphate isomerase [Cribrihabitans marinus]SEK08277.1 protein FrlC [Cribrihabitans marinus]
MKLSFNTWVYSSFPVWVPAYPLDEVIKRLARIGYDGIEIGAAAPHAYPDYISPERRREIRKLLDDTGIACSSMLPAPGGGAGFNVASADQAERDAAIDQYKKVADLCREWGAPTLMYVAGWQAFGTSRPKAWEYSRAALEKIADYANDLIIAVEPTSADSNLVDSCDDVIQMMDEVDRPNVGAMFDTFHTLYRNEVPTDYVHRLGSRLKHIHLADVNREPPGSGVVDYVSLIEALRDNKFDGYLTMEIGFNRRNVEPDDMARRAHDYLKSIL